MYVSVRVIRVRVSQGRREEFFDKVALEKVLDVFINKAYYATFLLSPAMEREFVVGHLYSEGLINSLEDVSSLKIQQNVADVEVPSLRLSPNAMRHGLVPLSCLVGGGKHAPASRLSLKIESNVKISAEVILTAFRMLHKRMPTFAATGCTHGAALLSEKGEVLCIAEDLGRHNAVDKAIGFALLNGVDVKRCILLLTGRETPQVVLKAARAGVPVVCSLSAPTLGAIKLARAVGITLVGFVRGSRLNIYSHPDRIVLGDQAMLC